MVIPNYLKKHYPFGQNSIEIKGNRLNYVDEGHGPVIVMLHGNPTWSFYFRNLITTLSKTHRVIVPDHIGCGLSDKPQRYDYTLKNHIDNVSELISRLALNKVSLVLHDWGGAIGFGHAVKNPKSIHKIVILNSAAFTSKLIPKRINLCKLPIVGKILVRGFNGFAYPATFMAVKKRLERDIKKGYLYPYNNYKNRVATYEFVKDIPLTQTHRSYSTLKSIEDKLNSVKCEKLILWGGQDFCFNMDFYNKWHAIFPTAKSTLIEDAGHYVLEDSKEKTLEIIENFFN